MEYKKISSGTKITYHKYLYDYPIDFSSEKLIVGTIHPHNTEDFKIQFFYGLRLSIWKLLQDAFPNELVDLSKASIISFLKAKKISVSDTIISCERKHNSALDKDLIPIEFNYKLIEDIKNSKIKEILFTSGFGKNNAFKIFYEKILGEKITSEIKAKREIIINNPKIGRPIKLTILYSPSGTANVGLSKSKIYLEHKSKYEGRKFNPVYQFKKDYYKEKFS